MLDERLFTDEHFRFLTMEMYYFYNENIVIYKNQLKVDSYLS